jgi:cystathionine beta-lyase
VRYAPPEGTYLAWLDCRALDLGTEPGDVFHERARVALVDGSRCGETGHVRLNFATPRPILRAIVERMAGAVA